MPENTGSSIIVISEHCILSGQGSLQLELTARMRLTGQQTAEAVEIVQQALESLKSKMGQR